MKPAKLSNYILLLLLFICSVAAGFFFFGGKVTSETNVQIPVYTDLLLLALVAVLGAALAVTFLAVIVRFAERFRRSPKGAVRSVLGLFILAFVMFFCWLCGSVNKLSLPGYSGSCNTPVWLKLTDMFIYSTYVLIGAAVLLIIGFYVGRKVR